MSTNNKKIKLIYIGLIAVLCVLLILSFYKTKDNKIQTNHINALRIESNQLYINISNSWPLDNDDINAIKASSQNSDLHYTIISLDETIICSNSDTIKISNPQLLIEALYMDESYITRYPNSYKLVQPIYYDNAIVGFAIFEKTYNTISSTNKIPIINIAIYGLLLIIIIFLGIKLFTKDSRELKAIADGLQNITKGILDPIAVDKNSNYQQIYHTYNALIDELKYVMEKQANSENQQKAFLTMISHELKTPIATINAYVEALTKNIAKDEKTKENYLEIIYDKTNQLTQQVEDFFKYAQNSASKFKYNFKECYIDALIEKIFLSISSQDGVHIKYENLLPACIVKVDKIRIEQVIMNLYNNAKKHSSNKDTISLSAYRSNNEIFIEVKDTGEGISAKDLPYIFDYYYQGQSSKIKDYSGIGLGLAICKSIIDNHNGRMKVQSKEGIGTTMYIILPIV